ncbi:MAG: NERD domain-containing protein, partial [Actinobacteria bacterium]|nr:NERD domain-containing protein [Actinomycetota bacterium]
WARGAGGEELVEQGLTRHCPDVVVLHDRRIPGSRANIDHIAIAASGVWVIDTKRYTGKFQVAKPLFGKPTLKIAGRDQTKLVDGLTRQVALVTPALAAIAPDIPVHGCFCFVDTELPLFGTSTINGFSIFGRRGLAKQLNAPGAHRRPRDVRRRRARRAVPTGVASSGYERHGGKLVLRSARSKRLRSHKQH